MSLAPKAEASKVALKISEDKLMQVGNVQENILTTSREQTLKSVEQFKYLSYLHNGYRWGNRSSWKYWIGKATAVFS